jgi:hypothetical protein
MKRKFIVIWIFVITMIGLIVIISPTVVGNPIKMGITTGVLCIFYIMTYIAVKYCITNEHMNEELTMIQTPIIDNIPVASAVVVNHDSICIV